MARRTNIRQFEVFKAIIESGSVSQAALALNISQPSVSKTLKQLEDQLGIELFARTARGLVATDVAHALHAEVARAYLSFENLQNYAAGLKELRHGRVIVSAISALAFNWLPGIIDRFLLDYPHSSVTMNSHDSRITRRLVASGMIDIGIAQESGSDPSIISRKICDLDIYLVVPQGHRLAGHAVAYPEDLRDERLILLSPDDLIRRQFEAMMQESGVETKCFIDVSLGSALCALVEKGHGIGFADSATIYTQQFRRIVPVVFSPAIKMPIHLFLNRQSSASLIVKIFADYVTATGDRLDCFFRA